MMENLSGFSARGMKPIEASQVADLHMRAFPGYFLSQLGGRFLALYYSEICADPAGIALVCHNESKIVGFAVGMMNPAGFYQRLFKRRGFSFMLAAIRSTLRHPSLIRRLLHAPKYADTLPRGEELAVLSSIAVAPEARGSGVGTLLMEEFVASVKRRGGKDIFWGAKKREDGTNRFYQKFGSSEVKEVRDSKGEAILEYHLRL
jgi:ribosomal protein S18 acetylase RimI-like enzyme